MTGELPEAFKVERSRRETARLEGSEGEGGKPGSFESGTGFAFDAEPGRPASWEEAAKRSLPTDPLLLHGELGRRGLRLQFRSAALEYY